MARPNVLMIALIVTVHGWFSASMALARNPSPAQAPGLSVNESSLLQRPVRDGDTYQLEAPLVFPLNGARDIQEVATEKTAQYSVRDRIRFFQTRCVATRLADPAELVTIRANRRVAVRWEERQDPHYPSFELLDAQSGTALATIRCRRAVQRMTHDFLNTTVDYGDELPLGSEEIWRSRQRHLRMELLTHRDLLEALKMRADLPRVQRREIRFRSGAGDGGWTEPQSEAAGAVL